MDKETANLLKKGREHYTSKNYDRAEAYLSRVVESGIRFADVMNMLGVIHHGRGQMALAQDYFEKALQINPGYIEAALNLAVSYNDVGQYEKAKALYSQITRVKRQSRTEIEPIARGKIANMHANLGRAYMEIGAPDKAIAQLQQALEMCPDYVDIRTHLGHALRDDGQLAAACEAFEQAKVARPTYLPARISLGMTYLALGDRELAKREWEAVLELDPKNTKVRMYLKIADHMMAQEEALEAGVHLEVTRPSTPPKPMEEELSFSFEGIRSSVSVLGAPHEGESDEDDGTDKPSDD